jgi:hypothetical protein
MVDFKDAIEARAKVDELLRQLRTCRYNPDLRRMQSNIVTMVNHLSTLEVTARRSRNYIKVDAYKITLAKAIDHLEKLIIILKLTE